MTCPDPLQTLEYLPPVYIMYGVHHLTLRLFINYARTLIFGAKYPVLAASSLGLWVVSRIAYSVGYLSGSPDKVRSRLFFTAATIFDVNLKRNNIVTRICATPSMFS